MVTTVLTTLLLACDGTTTVDSTTSDSDTGTSQGATDTGPFAGISITPTLLELSTSNGEPTSGSLLISSSGQATLEIRDISYGGTGVDLPGVLVWMAQGPLPLSITAGTTSTLNIEWTPDRPGDTTPLETDLTVTSNAAANPTYAVQITGENSAR